MSASEVAAAQPDANNSTQAVRPTGTPPAGHLNNIDLSVRMVVPAMIPEDHTLQQMLVAVDLPMQEAGSDSDNVSLVSLDYGSDTIPDLLAQHRKCKLAQTEQPAAASTEAVPACKIDLTREPLPWPASNLSVQLTTLSGRTETAVLRLSRFGPTQPETDQAAHRDHVRDAREQLKSAPKSLLPAAVAAKDCLEVLVSLGWPQASMATCLLKQRIGSRARQEAAWEVTSLFTPVGRRSQGLATALLALGIQEAMDIAPGPVKASAPHKTLLSVLTANGFAAQNIPGQPSWIRPVVAPRAALLQDPTTTLPVGIWNAGRHCSALACLQVLAGQPHLPQWLTAQTWPPHKGGDSLRTLLCHMDRQPLPMENVQSAIGILYLLAVRQNGSITGHHHLHTVDQDSTEYFTAILDLLDRELGKPAPVFRTQETTTVACSRANCRISSVRQTAGRVIQITVPVSSTPLRMDALLIAADSIVPIDTICTCGATQTHSISQSPTSADLCIYLNRGAGPHRVAWRTFHYTPVQIQTVLYQSGRPYLLRSVLLSCRVAGDPHWIMVTCRTLPNCQWYLVDDDRVTCLGDCGPHSLDVTLSLTEPALGEYDQLAAHAAFYSDAISIDWIPVPLEPMRGAAPLLREAVPVATLTQAGIKVTTCSTTALAGAELHRKINESLACGSPLGIQADYHSDLLDHLRPLLQNCPVTIGKPGGNASATTLENATMAGMRGRGHAEALLGGLQSPQLQAAGTALVRALNGQFGITLCPPPAGLVVTTGSFITDCHYHSLPVLNSGILTGARQLSNTVLWQSADQGQPLIVKGYIFISVDSLGAAGIDLCSGGSIKLEALIARIGLLDPVDRQSLLFEVLVMDGVHTTHVIFPQRTLHWVVTEAIMQHGAVYCGIGAYFLPNTQTALSRLRASLTENLTDRHTAQQPPGAQATLVALDAHIAGLATSTTLPPEHWGHAGASESHAADSGAAGLAPAAPGSQTSAPASGAAGLVPAAPGGHASAQASGAAGLVPATPGGHESSAASRAAGLAPVAPGGSGDAAQLCWGSMTSLREPQEPDTTPAALDGHRAGLAESTTPPPKYADA